MADSLEIIEHADTNADEQNTARQQNAIVTGLAIVGGIGLTIMTFALGIGVVQGAAANGGIIGALFWGGFILLFGATAGWFGVVRPDKNFDDINQPQYTGHHDDH